MPIVYSQKEAEINKIGWYRTGYDIAYYQNNQPFCKIFGESNDTKLGGGGGSKYSSIGSGAMANQKEPNNLYTLSFKFSLKHDKDDVYVAMCYPYTYTDCVNFLDKICAPQESPDIIRRTSLCKTLAGNNLEMLIITNFTSS